jgi:hypothetical protein
MAQKIYYNYKDLLASNDFNRVLLGVHEPGRYRGFDTMNVIVLAFTLSHEVTGIVQTRENLTQTNPTGIAITKQGFVIQEDAAISGLACASNAANAFTRIDLVVCTHEDVNVAGGQAATYSVIQGADGGAVVPSLPNPEKQIILGQISIPPSVANLSTATWTKTAAPLLGGANIFTNFPELDARYAKLLQANGPNAFTTQNQENYPATAMVVTSNRWTVPNTGNTFKSPSSTTTLNEIIGGRRGTRLKIVADGILNITLNVSPTGGGLLIGQVTLSIIMGITTVQILGGQSVELLNIETGWLITALPDNILQYIDAVETDVATLKTLQGFAHARMASDYNGGGGTGSQKILFDTEVSDSNNWFVPGATSRFTPLKAGKYKITVMVMFSKLETNSNNITLYIMKNGVSNLALAMKNGYVGASDPICLTGSGIVDANGTTDYFEMFHNVVGTAPASGYDFYANSYIQTEFLGT